jgi:hypothetical protein
MFCCARQSIRIFKCELETNFRTNRETDLPAGTYDGEGVVFACVPNPFESLYVLRLILQLCS